MFKAAQWTVVGVFMILFVACGDEAKQKGNTPPAPASADDKNANADGANADEDSTTSQSIIEGALVMGFDGTNDYSLIMPNFTDITVDDATVAEVSQVKVEFSDETIEALFEEAKSRSGRGPRPSPSPSPSGEGNSSGGGRSEFTIEQFKERIVSNYKAIKITSLKAGKTKIRCKAPAGRQRRGGPNGANDPCQGRSSRTLVVNQYDAAAVAKGQERYDTAGSGNLKACKSCHAAGDSKAPPHQLGGIKDYSDADVMTWITTGELDGNKAGVTHTWEFSSKDQEKGITPYLRTLASKDINTLAKLLIDDSFENGLD